MMLIVMVHILLALVLFRLVNWLGEHATDFGYASTTLFEEPTESLALNFLIRALAPSVYVVALGAIAVASGYPELRVGVYWIAIYYYCIRAAYIFAVNMQLLVNWYRFFRHAIVGLIAVWLAYDALILPNRSLLPDLDAAGNELWLAILAFIYAASNRVTVSDGGGARRRNSFVKASFDRAKKSFGELIDGPIADERLKLIAYSILIYEDYCRPPTVRLLERLIFWREHVTTGVMQVSSRAPLTDAESVRLGVKKLSESWLHHSENEPYLRVRETIADYNRDDEYVGKVLEVMEVVAKRAAPEFFAAYNGLYEAINTADDSKAE